MGQLFQLANFSKKERMDFDACKLGEIINSEFKMKMIGHYLSFFIDEEPQEIKFVSYERGGKENEDAVFNFKDITCDVLVDMFEDNYVPTPYLIGWIYTKFAEAKSMKELSDWLLKFEVNKKQ